jgi:hypothetical protein
MEESYRDFVDQILRPTNFDKLKPPEPYEKIVIRIFHNPGEEYEELELDQLYPFHTIEDLQTLIYYAMEKQEAYHPYNQCLLLPVDESKFPYLHFQYVFNDKPLLLANPFNIVLGNPDNRFVDLDGAPKSVKTINRQSVTLQTALFHKPKETYTIDLFLYTELLSNYPGERPINSTDWEGKFRVYFPTRDYEDESGTVQEKMLEEVDEKIKLFLNKLELIEKTESFLQEEVLRIPGEKGRGDPIGLANFRNLRFSLKRPSIPPGYDPIRLDSIFYDFPVSKFIPYVRYFPKATVPLSKVYVEGLLNIPALEKPEVLLQWAQEQSLTPQEDMIMIKFLIHESSGSLNPLYGTFFMFQDGSAKIVIQPNADAKSISRIELTELGTILDTFFDTVPTIKPSLSSKANQPRKMYSPKYISLDDAYVVFSLWLDREDRQITAKSLMKILPYFKPFFQVTSSPIKEQNPLGFLRYKSVDNFRTPARDFQFLHRHLDLQKLAGKTNIPGLVELYKEEFEVDQATAQARVGSFLKNDLEIQITNPEILSFDQAENPGIDIAIFGKQNQYSFHLYRVDSLFNLQMIKTLLSVLISAEPSFYTGSEEAVADLEEEEEEEEQAAEAAAEEEMTSPKGEKLPSASLVAAAAINGSSFEFDTLGAAAFDFQNSEEDEVVFRAEKPLPKGPTAQELADEDTPEFVAPNKGKKANKVGKTEKDEEGDLIIADPSEIKQIPAKTYFLSRLKYYDLKLFKWKLAPGEKNYGRQCSAAALRQPVVITEDQYQQMREEYEKEEEEGDLVWIDYPLPKGFVFPKSDKPDYERITTLRYGSTLLPGQANIYVCSQYWCRVDEMIVLKKDFEGTVDRKGRPKEKNTCPFCRGRLVITKDRIVPGESVISRSGKETHTFVGFLKKTNHINGYRLPCCFVKDTALYNTNPEFAGSIPKPFVKPVKEEITTEPQPEVSSSVVLEVNYAKTLASLPNSYILGAEKVPLEVTSTGPRMGILPGPLDKFFQQNSLKLVKQDHNVWKLIKDNRYGEPNVSGFFRIAAENRKQFLPEAFLSAVAPYYGLNSANDMKRVLKEVIKPPLFLSLNYGNFLFDFYNPQRATPPTTLLKIFSQKQLLLASGLGLQQEAVVRAWKGYVTFEESLRNPSVYKEYRQFAPLFTQPLLVSGEAGSLSQNGILFLVLEVRGKEVSVRCPPYGVTAEMARRCDIAFISYYPELGVWEPIFYTLNDAEKRIKNKYSLVFHRDEQESWPPIVKERVDEFVKSCEGSGMGLYTDSPRINPKTLLPLSRAMRITGTNVYGILRDTYNHVSSVMYEVDEKLIVVPVIDDGILFPTTRIELDWRNIILKLAPANVVKSFYTLRLYPVLNTLSEAVKETYRIDKIIRLDKSVPDLDRIYAFHLAGGLFVPVRKPLSAIPGIDEVTESAYTRGQELPWMVDSKLVYGKLDPIFSTQIDHKEFNEIFQHLRLTFSNWLSLAPSEFRGEIRDILFVDDEPNINLPLFEKRQRLFIKFGNEVMSWLDSTIPQRGRVQSVKRVDCHIVNTEKDCSNRCVWREAGESGTCLLHVPGTYEVGEKKVDVKILLVKKLIEELIRFPEKRDELLKQQVGKYQILRDGFRSGNEYIVPENLPAWSELLRMEWKKVSREVPKYAEEFMFAPLASANNSPEEENVPEVFEETGFPKVLEKTFGARSKDFHFLHEETNSIWPILAETAGLDPDEFEDKTGLNYREIPILDEEEQENINQLVKDIQLSVLFIVFTRGVDEKPKIVGAQGIIPSSGKSDVLLFTQLPNGKIGSISSSPTDVIPVPEANLPPILRLNLRRFPAIPLGESPVVPQVPQKEKEEVEAKPELTELEKETAIREEKEKLFKEETERLGRPLTGQERLNIVRRAKAMFN